MPTQTFVLPAHMIQAIPGVCPIILCASDMTDLVDVHAHLTAPELYNRIPTLLYAAHGVGVRDIIAVSLDCHDAVRVLALQEEHASSGLRVHAAVGLHPERADLASLGPVIELIRTQAASLVCVGEVGLDYRPHVLGDKADEVKETQVHVLKEQTRLAIELDLPVNVHSCGAGHHAISLLEELQARKVVMHAFDGKAHYAERAAALGMLFSVPPCIVRSPNLQKMVKRLPLHSLVLETDCPALAPGQRDVNVPENLLVSCKAIAEIKGLTPEQVAEATTHNAKGLFNRLKRPEEPMHMAATSTAPTTAAATAEGGSGRGYG